MEIYRSMKSAVFFAEYFYAYYFTFQGNSNLCCKKPETV